MRVLFVGCPPRMHAHVIFLHQAKPWRMTPHQVSGTFQLHHIWFMFNPNHGLLSKRARLRGSKRASEVEEQSWDTRIKPTPSLSLSLSPKDSMSTQKLQYLGDVATIESTANTPFQIYAGRTPPLWSLLPGTWRVPTIITIHHSTCA